MNKNNEETLKSVYYALQSRLNTPRMNDNNDFYRGMVTAMTIVSDLHNAAKEALLNNNGSEERDADDAI